jgi:hypothetical protein
MKLPWRKRRDWSEEDLRQWIITAPLAGAAIGLACIVAIIFAIRIADAKARAPNVNSRFDASYAKARLAALGVALASEGGIFTCPNGQIPIRPRPNTLHEAEASSMAQ